MGHTVFTVGLRRGQLVVAGELELVVLQVENRVRAPLVRIVRAAACAESAAPLIGEQDFLSVIRKRSRMPVRIIRIVHRIEAFWIRWVFDVDQDAVTGARAGSEPER